MNEENKRALLSILCHGSIFFSCFIVSVAIPLAILYTSTDRVVRANAKEALNFHLTIYIWNIIGWILIFSLILSPFGLIFLLIACLLSIILPICGVIAVMNKPSIPYHYPEIFRLIK
ncbi:MAG: DUF4870 domain-containing protein [Cyanobacteriota bacterium]|nr:DUF4870 domain-containing protein [Cyanobacteriota bacterium]